MIKPTSSFYYFHEASKMKSPVLQALNRIRRNSQLSATIQEFVAVDAGVSPLRLLKRPMLDQPLGSLRIRLEKMQLEQAEALANSILKS